MPVRMFHPKHGWTNAVGSEIAWNKSNGWRVEVEEPNPVAPAEKVAKPDGVLVVPRETFADVSITDPADDANATPNPEERR